jgi:flavin-dependent dehydrogenase
MSNTGLRSVDVLVIGAGPAGLSTALHLVQHDPEWAQRLLVLEKAAHPRPKLCGGGVTRLGVQELAALKMPFPLPIPQVQVEDARMVYGRHTAHVRGRPIFTVFNRAELDAYLARQACQQGVLINENEPVQGIEWQEDGIVVVTPKGCYRARVVVGADGSNGISRRIFNHFEAEIRVARLLEMLDPAEPTDPLFNDHYAVMEFTPASQGLQGYAWKFPSLVGGRPYFNIGVYDSRVVHSRPKADLREILQDSMATWGEMPGEAHLAGHPICWFNPHAQFATRGMLLVGDAAGVDPLFGEGIAPSLAYGSVAAQAIRQAFVNGDFSFWDYRQHVLNSRVGKYLQLRSIAAGLCYYLSGYARFMFLVWAFGILLADIVPPPSDLYG